MIASAISIRSPGRRRQLERAQERAPVGSQQLVGDVGDAVVKQRRLDPLHPTGALVDQRLAQPRPGPPLAHVRRRDPRLRQPPLTQQRPQPARVGAIGLGPSLLAAQRARLRRLGQVRHRTRRRERLAHEQPPGARLHGHVHLLARKAGDPRADGLAISANPATVNLARHGVQRIEGDLRSMHIKPGYDRHQGPPLKLRPRRHPRVSRTERRGPRPHALGPDGHAIYSTVSCVSRPR